MAVVLGLSPTGLYAIRELAGAGLSLLGVDREYQCARFSRYLRQGFGLLRDTGSAELLSALCEFADAQPTRPYLLPTSDYYVEFLLDHYDALSEYFHLSPGYSESAAQFLDKGRFGELCTREGVATPGTWSPRDRSELKGLVGDLAFPCIVKPTLIHRVRHIMRGKKVLVLRCAGEMQAFIAQLPDEKTPWLVQEIIPGAESNIVLVAGYAGATPVEFTARKLRQYPAGFGSASLAVSEALPGIAARTRAFVASTGYQGIYGAEYKLDPRDQRHKLIEINPRPTLWFHLSHASGKHIARHAWQMDSGQPVPEPAPQSDGVLWRYWLKDTMSAARYRLAEDSCEFPPPHISSQRHLSSRCWAVYDAADPLPACLEWTAYLRKAIKRVL